MCGIAGIISTNQINFSSLKSMSDKISHRGPDDEGFLIFGNTDTLNASKLEHLPKNTNVNIGLAHRRLSIHDLSEKGHQPMTYLEKYKIVFNGEIYNYLELKTELQNLGYSFYSDTDTEVIMAAYDAWGSDCLNRFNGMWAFVLINIQTQKIFISRDRFGIKPLFYFKDKNNFIFASEIKSIFESGIATKELNLAYCKEYLKVGPREWTKDCIFKNIYRFDCASFYDGSFEDILQNSFELNKYWKLEVDGRYEKFDEQNLNEYSKKYLELFNDAIKLRLMADVKVSSSLSGGLDSSSIVYTINKQLHGDNLASKQEVFSSVYSNINSLHCDETSYINLICNKLDIKSNKIEPDANGILSEYIKLIHHFDTPPVNSIMSSWHTYKLEKANDITVTLDGQGADEDLAGYEYYFFTHFFNLPYSDIFKELFLCSGKNKSYAIKGAIFKIINTFFGLNTCKKILAKLGKDDSFLMSLNAKLSQDMQEELINNFHIDDLASMAHSVEARMPFMDYRLVEFMAKVPATYKLHNGWSKFIGRFAFNKLLPDEIAWRKDKMGWAIPEDFWFKDLHKNWAIEQIQNSTILKILEFDTKSLVQNFDNVSVSKIMLPLNLAIWYDYHFGGKEF